MHTLTVQSRWLPDAVYPLPSRWEELSAAQLRRVAWLSSLPLSGISLAKLFFLALTESLPWWQRFRLRWFYIVESTVDEKADLLLFVDSFREKQVLTEQKFPKIALKAKKIGAPSVLLFGPTSRLGNVTFWEYIQAEKHYLNYLEASQKAPNGFDSAQPDTPIVSPRAESRGNTEIAHLNLLVATLYRQERPDFRMHIDADIRIPLTSEGAKWRMHLVERMNMDTKLVILMWFESCRAHIQKSFPAIFGKPAKASPTDKAKPLAAKEQYGQHWIRMISELAGGMQHYDAIGNTPVWTAFADITHRIKKSEEAHRELERSKRKRK